MVTLEAIGYICMEIEPIEVLAARSNEILTVIVHCMRKEETSDRVRLAATNALQNSLEFSKTNFSNDNERHYIMQVGSLHYNHYAILGAMGYRVHACVGA